MKDLVAIDFAAAVCKTRRLFEEVLAFSTAKVHAARDQLISLPPQKRQLASLATFATLLAGLYGFGATSLLNRGANPNRGVVVSNLDVTPGLSSETTSALKMPALDLTTPEGKQIKILNGAPRFTSLGVNRRNVIADRQEPLKPLAKPIYKTLEVKLGWGDTLMEVLVRGGVPRQEAYEAITAMRPTLNPRRLRAGQELTYTLQIAPQTPQDLPSIASVDMAAAPAEPFTPQLASLDIKMGVDRRVIVNRNSDSTFSAKEVIAKLEERYVRAGGKIDSSLFLAAETAGIPSQIVLDLIRIYSYDVDFQREIRKGDTFEVFFTRYVDTDGQTIKTGTIHFGSLKLSGKSHVYYRHTTPDDGQTGYYDIDGQSSRKFLMKTPIDGARISSGFGRRRHPVLGYNKMHQGVDFAAPRGTPIMAAGEGMVERASRYGNYGNYILIRHTNGYKTAYAHLKSYAKGVRKGAHVQQGQIVGYVGTTGRSTGPHLHYEVLYNNKRVNPLKIRVPTGRKLSGETLEAFLTERDKMDAQMAGMPIVFRLKTVKLD